ncbi:hypothetical protein PI124_g15132 [Phytophthora idaei]|nr:hypothetical protein PI124_g15132 [Phytophthora idaei]
MELFDVGGSADHVSRNARIASVMEPGLRALGMPFEAKANSAAGDPTTKVDIVGLPATSNSAIALFGPESGSDKLI